MPILTVGSFEQIEFVAVGISSCGHDRRHVGIFYRSSGTLQFLHLAWHFDLRSSSPKHCYGWVQPNLNPARSRNISALCRLILRKNLNGIPYAFSSPNDCIDSNTGAYLLGPTNHGLSCATFVAAVFHAGGLPLIQYDSWPPVRQGDSEWKAFVIEQLQASGASSLHIEAVKIQDNARVRPEDIVAASHLAPAIPASFSAVDPVAAAVVADIERAALTVD
jgi:hypothetical protein